MEVTITPVTELAVADDGLPAYRESNQGPILDLSILFPEKGAHTSFDIAQVRLQSAIKTQSGSQVSVQKVNRILQFLGHRNLTLHRF